MRSVSLGLVAAALLIGGAQAQGRCPENSFKVSADAFVRKMKQAGSPVTLSPGCRAGKECEVTFRSAALRDGKPPSPLTGSATFEGGCFAGLVTTIVDDDLDKARTRAARVAASLIRAVGGDQSDRYLATEDLPKRDTAGPRVSLNGSDRHPNIRCCSVETSAWDRSIVLHFFPHRK